MYDRRYAVEADMALMGSNRFKSGNKYFFSAAGGLAWILSNEDFLKDNEYVNFLKLKTSAGILGYDRSTEHLFYERAWSQAQETVQPEMVLFPEKGAIFWELDVKRQVKNHIRWAGNNEISLQEAQMRTFSNFAWMFLQTEGEYNFSSGSRGRGNLSSTANPYFLFPQIYNFRYNIYSSEWPVANRTILGSIA